MSEEKNPNPQPQTPPSITEPGPDVVDRFNARLKKLANKLSERSKIMVELAIGTSLFIFGITLIEWTPEWVTGRFTNTGLVQLLFGIFCSILGFAIQFSAASDWHQNALVEEVKRLRPPKEQSSS